MGGVAEDLACTRLALLFDECVVSKIVNGLPHDIEIRIKDEPLTDKICRIQVKSTNHTRVRPNGELCYLQTFHRGGGKRYEIEDADFFLFYVWPAGKFYVVPGEAIQGKLGTLLYPDVERPRGRAKFEKYLEAWPLIGDFLGVPPKMATPTTSTTPTERSPIDTENSENTLL
jgi:hypothetical protein